LNEDLKMLKIHKNAWKILDDEKNSRWGNSYIKQLVEEAIEHCYGEKGALKLKPEKDFYKPNFRRTKFT